jgi:hypothetical protein
VANSAAGAELRIHYDVIERILAREVFTEEGRKYVRGSKVTPCNFAYLEKPRIAGDNGRLEIKARFTGRSARNLFGRCIGLGDAFDVAISAVPYYHDGAIRLKEVLVESKGRDSFYIRRVRALLAASFAKDFQYRVADDAKKMLEEKTELFRQELVVFQVPAIRITREAVVLALDFTLSVK